MHRAQIAGSGLLHVQLHISWHNIPERLHINIVGTKKPARAWRSVIHLPCAKLNAHNR